jgi:hypothetical protein
MVKRGLFILFLLTGTRLLAQTGGDNVYEFLNLTHSGLVASLGGSNVSLRSPDLNLAYHNPALLSAEMDKNLTISYVNYFAGINYGMSMYARSYPRAGNFAAGITYLNYGSFTESDESGNITGSFRAAEYAMSLIWSHEVDSLFSFGVNLKPVLSHLESYSSFGIALDAGASYQSRNKLFSAGIVLKNIGVQITSYTGETREKLPFEIQAGVSQRLSHAPFRFSLTLRHLEKFDLTYTYDENIDQSGSSASSASGFGENLLRHMVIGTELIPHKNFYFSVGYNYQRRREMQIESKVSSVGFSWGFGINTSYLSLAFGRASYHLAGASNNITLIIRPDMLYRKLSR